MSLLLLFRPSAGDGPEPEPPVVVTPSGGYGFGSYDRKVRRKHELEEYEREELADRLEAVLVQEGSITQTDADLLRVRGLVAQYEGDLPNRVKRAALYAERVRTQEALILALRELERLAEEEMHAIHIALMFDD